MAKNKQKKKKERERKVAKKKLADAAKRREQEAAPSADSSRPRKVIEAPTLQVPGTSTDSDQPDARSPFGHRKLGG